MRETPREKKRRNYHEERPHHRGGGGSGLGGGGKGEEGDKNQEETEGGVGKKRRRGGGGGGGAGRAGGQNPGARRGPGRRTPGGGGGGLVKKGIFFGKKVKGGKGRAEGSWEEKELEGGLSIERKRVFVGEPPLYLPGQLPYGGQWRSGTAGGRVAENQRIAQLVQGDPPGEPRQGIPPHSGRFGQVLPYAGQR